MSDRDGYVSAEASNVGASTHRQSEFMQLLSAYPFPIYPSQFDQHAYMMPTTPSMNEMDREQFKSQRILYLEQQLKATKNELELTKRSFNCCKSKLERAEEQLKLISKEKKKSQLVSVINEAENLTKLQHLKGPPVSETKVVNDGANSFLEVEAVNKKLAEKENEKLRMKVQIVSQNEEELKALVKRYDTGLKEIVETVAKSRGIYKDLNIFFDEESTIKDEYLTLTVETETDIPKTKKPTSPPPKPDSEETISDVFFKAIANLNLTVEQLEDLEEESTIVAEDETLAVENDVSGTVKLTSPSLKPESTDNISDVFFKAMANVNLTAEQLEEVSTIMAEDETSAVDNDISDTVEPIPQKDLKENISESFFKTIANLTFSSEQLEELKDLDLEFADYEFRGSMSE